MKKIARKDKYGLCIDEYKYNKTFKEVYMGRASGKYPEMESSKAEAQIIKKLIKENYFVLDAGCACGHYYRSFKRVIKKKFTYTGMDPYEILLDGARQVWKNETNVNFKQGNLFKMPFKSKQFDLVVCNNVLTHIHKIKKPIKELLRVSKKYVVLRTPLDINSYRIQIVYNNKWWNYTNVTPENEFDDKGNPRSFSYFDILSFDYLISVIKSHNKKAKIKFIKDTFFNKNLIQKSFKNEKRPLATRIIGGEQISGCIMHPAYFVIIEQ